MTNKHLSPRVIACGFAAFLIVTTACSADRAREHADCDIQSGPCVRIAGARTEITLDITPRPVKAMAELLFTVTVRKDGKPVSGADVTLDLTMPGMVMGENKPRLSPAGGGRYAGKGVVVRCPSGIKIWKAQVTIHAKQGAETASFIFEVI
ncbi:MAG: FixH family protein [Nitrospirota bacterium]